MKSYNKNIFITLLLLIFVVIILSLFRLEVFHSSLVGMFFIFFIIFSIPSSIVFKDDDIGYYFSQSVAILAFSFWYKTHNPFIIKLFLFALFLIPSFIIVIKEKKELEINNFDKFIFASFIILTLSLILKQFSDRLAEWSFFFFGFYISFILFRLVKNKKKFIHYWLYIGTIISIYTLLQWFSLDFLSPIDNGKTPLGFRTIGTLGNPNFLSGYLIGIFSFLLYFVISQRGKKYYYILLIIQFFALISTGTRGIFVALLLTLILFVILKKNKLFLLVLLGISVVIFIIPSTRHRLLMIPKQITQKEGSLGQRFLMWNSALKMVKEKPFGVGLAGYRLNYPEYQAQYLKNPRLLGLSTHARHPHDEFLEVALIGGPLLFFLYSILFLFIFKLIKKTNHNLYLESGLFAFLTILIHNLASVVLNYEEILINFAIIMAIIVFFIKWKKVIKISYKWFYLIIIIAILLSLFWLKNTIASYYFSKGVTFMNGYTYEKKENFLNIATKNFFKSLSYNKSYVNTYYRIGNCYLLWSKAKKDPTYLNKAIEFFKKADHLKPHYYEIRYNLGLTELKLKKYKEAILWFQQALQLEPFKLNVLKELYEANFQLYLQKKVNHEVLLQILKKLYKALILNKRSLQYNENKNDLSLYNSMLDYYYRQKGYLLYEMGSYNKALNVYEKGYKEALNNNQMEYVKFYLNNCIAVAKKENRIDLIDNYFQKLREIFPKSANIYLDYALFKIKYHRNINEGINMINNLLQFSKGEQRMLIIEHLKSLNIQNLRVINKLNLTKKEKQMILLKKEY